MHTHSHDYTATTTTTKHTHTRAQSRSRSKIKNRTSSEIHCKQGRRCDNNAAALRALHACTRNGGKYYKKRRAFGPTSSWTTWPGLGPYGAVSLEHWLLHTRGGSLLTSRAAHTLFDDGCYKRRGEGRETTTNRRCPPLTILYIFAAAAAALRGCCCRRAAARVFIIGKNMAARSPRSQPPLFRERASSPCSAAAAVAGRGGQRRGKRRGWYALALQAAGILIQFVAAAAEIWRVAGRVKRRRRRRSFAPQWNGISGCASWWSAHSITRSHPPGSFSEFRACLLLLLTIEFFMGTWLIDCDSQRDPSTRSFGKIQLKAFFLIN